MKTCFIVVIHSRIGHCSNSLIQYADLPFIPPVGSYLTTYGGSTLEVASVGFDFGGEVEVNFKTILAANDEDMETIIVMLEEAGMQLAMCNSPEWKRRNPQKGMPC